MLRRITKELSERPGVQAWLVAVDSCYSDIAWAIVGKLSGPQNFYEEYKGLRFQHSSYLSLYFGHMSSGKTVQMICDMFEQACLRKWTITTNFQLYPDGIYAYAEWMDRKRKKRKKYDHLKRLCDDNLIRCIPCDDQWRDLFRNPYSCVAFDEIGGKMNSRNYSKKDKSGVNKHDIVLRAIEQCRKIPMICFATAQNPEQVDAAARRHCDNIIFCQGFSLLDLEKGYDVLIFRSAKYFDKNKFWDWYEDDERRFKKPVWSALQSRRSDSGLVRKKHKLLFNCYRSHE